MNEVEKELENFADSFHGSNKVVLAEKSANLHNYLLPHSCHDIPDESRQKRKSFVKVPGNERIRSLFLCRFSLTRVEAMNRKLSPT